MNTKNQLTSHFHNKPWQSWWQMLQPLKKNIKSLGKHKMYIENQQCLYRTKKKHWTGLVKWTVNLNKQNTKCLLLTEFQVYIVYHRQTFSP